MIILGIDQGLANIGYAIISTEPNLELLEHGIIKTKPDPVFGRRLLLIESKLLEVIEKYKPDLICTEALFCNKAQSSGRNKSAAIVQTNMATAVIFMLGAEKNIPIRQFVPISVKKQVTGSGKATKEEVEDAIKQHFKDVIIKKDHESDAIAIALTGHFSVLNGLTSCEFEEEPKETKKKKTKKKKEK